MDTLKAEQAGRRVINLDFNVRLTPPQDGELGSTDAARLIGHGIIRETLRMLKNMGEAEGFAVEIEVRQVVV